MFSVILAPLFAALPGCSAEPEEAQSENVAEKSGYEMDIALANEIWHSTPPIEKPADAWTAVVKVGDKTLIAPTHLFGDVVNVIPYSNDDNIKTGDGQPFERGDQVIAQYYKPGTVGIALKMHRPEHRTVDLTGADPSAMKEDFKLQDTHIEVVIGVEAGEHGKPGAITLNNPQGYEGGRFGNKNYSMIFLSIDKPTYVDEATWKLYMDNIRTAAAGFNSTSEFPGDYNGGDPLSVKDPEKLRFATEQMVRSIAGDLDALKWFQEKENLLYCAEFAFASLSAGLIVPLNATTMVPRVGQEVWDEYVAQVELHNKGVDHIKEHGELPLTPSRFVELNENKYIATVRLVLAPETLRPLSELAPDPAEAAKLLALQPLTMSDIVEQFMRTHLPREILGEALAPVQGAVLEKMRPGLLETMGMDQLPATDPKRAAVEALYTKIVQVVSKSFGSYHEFRAAVEPLLMQARKVTGPRDDSGNGLFVPPSLFHVAAQGKFHGLIGLQYVGHGVHATAVKQAASPNPEPIDDTELPATGTCGGPDTAQPRANSRCGGYDVAMSCQCDGECTTYGDCCDDYSVICSSAN